MGGSVKGMGGMALTAELVALCHREVSDPGPDPDWTPLTDEVKAEEVVRCLAEAGPGPIRVFAYGSLIWRPGFEPARRLRARAHGWHRAFCLPLTRFRGTPEAPGLMMALERGGSCTGLAFEIAEERRAEDLGAVLWREMPARDYLGARRWITIETAEGPSRALVFWAGSSVEEVERRLPLTVVAARLARACGHGGSGAEYLYNTVLHLEEHGIRDRNLWRLQALVAEEILAMHEGRRRTA
ncbi:MAG TPA: gamma-glutamylcyclotransferase [Paracoccaceae bacterium]|nr:gamma-glutamylcyclotransferase [Paracoccaceae bacterium]